MFELFEEFISVKRNRNNKYLTFVRKMSGTVLFMTICTNLQQFLQML